MPTEEISAEEQQILLEVQREVDLLEHEQMRQDIHQQQEGASLSATLVSAVVPASSVTDADESD